MRMRRRNVALISRPRFGAASAMIPELAPNESPAASDHVETRGGGGRGGDGRSMGLATKGGAGGAGFSGSGAGGGGDGAALGSPSSSITASVIDTACAR